MLKPLEAMPPVPTPPRASVTLKPSNSNWPFAWFEVMLTVTALKEAFPAL